MTADWPSRTIDISEGPSQSEGAWRSSREPGRQKGHGDAAEAEDVATQIKDAESEERDILPRDTAAGRLRTMRPRRRGGQWMILAVRTPSA